MRHGSLFSGIGGFDLAAQWMGWENVFQVEIDPFCQKVLEKNFPEVTRYGDIKEFDGTKYRGAVDIISGGFPCQPFSNAGFKNGKEDDRYLWPEMFRIVREIEPSFVVGENVTGIIGMAIEDVLSEMEDFGYSGETFIIPACAVGGIHRRDRVWIVAYSNRLRLQRGKQWDKENPDGENINVEILPTSSFLKGKEDELPEPKIIRGNDGIPNRVDRIKSLGNSVVPQVVFEIFKAIQIVHESIK